MMNASSKDGELPAADSCAIMEGEDAEDELVFNNRHSILRKFMALSRKVCFISFFILLLSLIFFQSE